MCTQVLRDTYNGEYLKKDSKLYTNSSSMKQISDKQKRRTVCGDTAQRPHKVISGSTWVKEGSESKRQALSTLSGGCAKIFAKNILACAQDDLLLLVGQTVGHAYQGNVDDICGLATWGDM